MYKLCVNKDPFTGEVFEPNMVCKDGRLWIPFNNENKDYQEYLKWLDEGNTPEPAEEQQ